MLLSKLSYCDDDPRFLTSHCVADVMKVRAARPVIRPREIRLFFLATRKLLKQQVGENFVRKLGVLRTSPQQQIERCDRKQHRHIGDYFVNSRNHYW